MLCILVYIGAINKNTHYTTLIIQWIGIIHTFPLFCMICRKWMSHFPKVLSYNWFVERQNMTAVKFSLFQKNHCAGNVQVSPSLTLCPSKCVMPREVIATKYSLEQLKRVKEQWAGTMVQTSSSLQWTWGTIKYCAVQSQRRWPKSKDTQRFDESSIRKLYADNGYISLSLLASLFDRGVHIVTGRCTNMENKLTNIHDNILLRQRSNYWDHQRYAEECSSDSLHSP